MAIHLNSTNAQILSTIRMNLSYGDVKCFRDIDRPFLLRLSYCVVGGKLGCQERTHGLFYSLLQTEEDSISEVGMISVFEKQSKTTCTQKVVVENNFHFEPASVSERVASVSMSCSHAALVAHYNNGVFSWGHAEDGALGLDQHLISSFDPSVPTPVTSNICQIKEVACGADFSLMLTMEGLVYSCGSGEFGKLGHGNEEDRRLPTKVRAFYENYRPVAGGGVEPPSPRFFGS